MIAGMVVLLLVSCFLPLSYFALHCHALPITVPNAYADLLPLMVDDDPNTMEEILKLKTNTRAQFNSIESSSTLSPYLQNLHMKKRFCEDICKKNPSKGGSYCHCDSVSIVKFCQIHF